MTLHFYKYQGCGNDFILLDNRSGDIKLSNTQIKQLCHRHFGVGANGLMLLEKASGYDFKMVYYNSDGNESTLCGNGGRCITAFAYKLGLLQNKAHFIAIDGEHISLLKGAAVSLKMNDVKAVEKHSDYFFVNTGSPHVVKWVEYVKEHPVFEEGKKMRYDATFKSINGANVNFIQQKQNGLYVRTYERGVEDETLSCGTGVTAAALVNAVVRPSNNNTCHIQTLGGNLEVSYKQNADGSFTDIWLTGAATFVFEGDYTLF